MAPRKKKPQKAAVSKASPAVAAAVKSKPKENVKKASKPPKAPKVVVSKKKAPVKKPAPRKPRAAKNSPISIAQTKKNVEKLVENDIELEKSELLTNVSETLDESSSETQNYTSVEDSIEGHIVGNDSVTVEITEQMENLEVQETEPVEEIIEFDTLDNVITVDCQEVTVEDVENSNEGTMNQEISLELSKEEDVRISPRSVDCDIENNLSIMMNDIEEPVETIENIADLVKTENNDMETEFEVKIEKDIDIDEDERKNLGKMEDSKFTDEEQSEIKDLVTEKVKTQDEINREKDENKIAELLADVEKKLQDKAKLKQAKTQKKKDKSKNPKSKTMKSKDEQDDNSIRRSSRIKTISDLKKPSVGHGLVKMKEFEIADLRNEDESNQASLANSAINESISRPIKVKSRWRRSSELEMNVSNTTTLFDENLKINDNLEESLDKEKLAMPVKDELVEARLKTFIHLKENSYLNSADRLVCKEAKKMTCDCFLTREEIERGEMACGEDCLNRLLMIECGNLCQVGDRCANKKFQKGQFAPVEAFNTHKKGLGLRAAANIPYGEFILEYVGEVLNAEEFDKRAEEYSQDKNQHYYFMSLRADAIIDATRKGNISRFINHSCEPNAETQKWTVNGELRIGFFSTRTILAGEEVTFDYRFERYGKEAQKCYCGAPSCRGWLGEEPDEDEEGEDDEEEEEEEEVEETAEVSKPIEPAEAKVDSTEIEAGGEATSGEKLVEPIPAVKIITKVKKPKPMHKLRKEMFEDDQLDADIEMLTTTGLKNQAHTLKMSRLMLRAKEPSQRTKLLKVLRRGELPCRRLFLDYHGLRLMHGYMTDAQYLCKKDKKYDSLRLEMLQTLAVLPIPNKTMLQDSKVLPMVEKWSIPLSTASPLDSESNSPKTEADACPSPVRSPTPIPTEDASDEKPFDEHIRGSVGMDEVKTEFSYFTNTKGSALAEEIAGIFEDDAYVASPKPKVVEPKPPPPNFEEEITALASKLLEAWSNLKETFRIPKRERIEQMKEHEREANKGYMAGLGIEQYTEKKNETRYRGMQRNRPQDKKNFKNEERSQQLLGTLSKHNRRKLFAMQVEQQEEERRRKQRELWQQHERNCMVIGTDPRFTAPFDPTRGFQCIWNPQIGQWQNYPLPPERSPRGYGSGISAPCSLPNTNLPPPNMTPSSTYPYGIPSQIQMPSGAHPPIPPIPSSRSHSHIVSPMPVGRACLPTQAPHQRTQVAHQMTPAPHPMTPSPHQMTPAPHQLTPTPLQMTATPHQMTVTPHQMPLAPHQMPPTSHQMTQAPHQMTPTPHQMTPTPHQMTPTQHQMTPTPHQMTTVPHQMAPTNVSTMTTNIHQTPTLPPLPPLNTHLPPPTPVPQTPPPVQTGVSNLYQTPSYPPPPIVAPSQSPVVYQDKNEGFSMIGAVKFMGPIPPPVTLPPKWKCAKDKYGRPYYYHIRQRKSQWEPPILENTVAEPEEESESSSSESSSSSSDSSSDDSESDDEIINDSRLLKQVRKHLRVGPSTKRTKIASVSVEDTTSLMAEPKKEEMDAQPSPEIESSIDKRLKEQFNLMNEDSPPVKRKKGSLVEEIIISPRTEDDKLQFREDLKRYKENKEMLKKQKEVILLQTKKHLKEKKLKQQQSKEKLREMKYSNSEYAKKIKETFRSSMANTVVSALNAYRKPDCTEGRITNTEDFKHLARKLTHFVMLKEMKYISEIEELVCSDNVKAKARDYIRKYMSKFGEVYIKRDDEPEHYY